MRSIATYLISCNADWRIDEANKNDSHLLFAIVFRFKSKLKCSLSLYVFADKINRFFCRREETPFIKVISFYCTFRSNTFVDFLCRLTRHFGQRTSFSSFAQFFIDTLEMEIGLQDQIYIVSAAVVVVAVVLLIFCITLCISVNRLKALLKEQKRKEIITARWNFFKKIEFTRKYLDNFFRESKYAYNNPSIQPDEELHYRGYLMHQGQIVPRITRYIIQYKHHFMTETR